MYRRLFYIFPDKESVLCTIKELREKKIALSQMHTLAKPEHDMSALPAATNWQKTDLHSKLESYAWNINLILFLTMFVVLIYALSFALMGWAIFAGSMMLASLLAGYQYIHIPSLRLSEFSSAIKHGEILLMIDLPRNQLKPIDDYIHQHHAEAVEGGVSWIPAHSKM